MQVDDQMARLPVQIIVTQIVCARHVPSEARIIPYEHLELLPLQLVSHIDVKDDNTFACRKVSQAKVRNSELYATCIVGSYNLDGRKGEG
jgi:hypothetical protein